MLLRTPNQPLRTSPLVIPAAGERYRQTILLFYVGCLVDTCAVIMPEIRPQTGLVGACYNRFKRELYVIEAAAFTLEVPMRKVEVAEALLYGFVTKKLRQEHFDDLRTMHHNFLRHITTVVSRTDNAPTASSTTPRPSRRTYPTASRRPSANGASSLRGVNSGQSVSG